MKRITSFLNEKHTVKNNTEKDLDLPLWDSRNFSYVDHLFPDITVKVLNNNKYSLTKKHESKTDEYLFGIGLSNESPHEITCYMFLTDVKMKKENEIAQWNMDFSTLTDLQTHVLILKNEHKGKRFAYYGFLILKLHMHLNYQQFKIWCEFPSKTIPWHGVYYNSMQWGDQYKYVTGILLNEPNKFKDCLTCDAGDINDFMFDNNGCKKMTVVIGKNDTGELQKKFINALKKTFTVKMTGMLFNYILSEASYSSQEILLKFEFNGIPKHQAFKHSAYPSFVFERIGIISSQPENLCNYNIINTEDFYRVYYKCVVYTKNNGGFMNQVIMELQDNFGDRLLEVIFKEDGPSSVTFRSSAVRGIETLKLLCYIILYDYQFLYRHLFSSVEQEKRDKEEEKEEE